MSKNDQQRLFLKTIQRQDFLTFVRLAFTVLYGNEEFTEAGYIEVICDRLAQCRESEAHRLLVCLPPRHLKSFIISVCFPAWMLGHDPTLEVIAASYNDELSAKLGKDCLALMQSEMYRELFPATSISPIKSSAGDFATTKGGGRMATSVGGTITGRGADILILDDPIKPADVYSELQRRKVVSFVLESFLTRLNLKAAGIVIATMQRLHPDDIIGILNEQGGWELMSFPAIAEQEEAWTLANGEVLRRSAGQVLNPVRESLETLDKQKHIMGERAFSAQYQQRPVPADGLYFQPEYLPVCPKVPPEFAQSPITISVDAASKTGAINDFTAVAVLSPYGSGRTQCFLTREVHRIKMEIVSLHAFVRALADKWAQKARVTLVIEDTSAGTALIQMLRNNPGSWNIHAYSPKFSKQERVQAHLDIFGQRQVHFLAGPWVKPFLDEALSFPNGRNDDQVDAVIQAIAYHIESPTPRIRRI